MSASALLHDLAWDSPLTLALALDATAAMFTRGAIVHLGCRTALMDREFIARGQSVTGVDPSARMLRRALRRHRLTIAVHADASHTGLATASASGVLVSNLLHEHPDPRAVLAEALRIAMPGARIVLLWPGESASLDTLRRLDHRRGWGRPAAILADALRRLGMVGGPPRSDATSEPRTAAPTLSPTPTPTPDALIRDLLTDLLNDPTVSLVSSSVIFDCQHVAILQLQAPSSTDASAASESPFALISHDGDNEALARVEEHDRESESRRRAVPTRTGR